HGNRLAPGGAEAAGMRLNWFSPLPPTPSGIAEYTAQLLPFLAERASVVLWSDRDEWDRALEEHARVRYYHPEHPPWAELNRADLSVFHTGNSPWHAALWGVNRSHPGLVVLHDLNLHHFLNAWHNAILKHRPGYVADLTRYYGADGAWAAEARHR